MEKGSSECWHLLHPAAMDPTATDLGDFWEEGGAARGDSWGLFGLWCVGITLYKKCLVSSLLCQSWWCPKPDPGRWSLSAAPPG